MQFEETWLASDYDGHFRSTAPLATKTPYEEHNEIHQPSDRSHRQEGSSKYLFALEPSSPSICELSEQSFLPELLEAPALPSESLSLKSWRCSVAQNGTLSPI